MASSNAETSLGPATDYLGGLDLVSMVEQVTCLL